eukprot:4610267-Prymnesium_polylepis.1
MVGPRRCNAKSSAYNVAPCCRLVFDGSERAVGGGLCPPDALALPPVGVQRRKKQAARPPRDARPRAPAAGTGEAARPKRTSCTGGAAAQAARRYAGARTCERRRRGAAPPARAVVHTRFLRARRRARDAGAARAGAAAARPTR